MNRRSFIGLAGAAALGCATRNNAPTFDDNLSVLISDPHVNGDPAIVKYLYPREWLIKTVTEILAMRPLPKHVILFGDLAFDHGRECDYKAAKEVLQPLYDAGIKIVLRAMEQPLREIVANAGDEPSVVVNNDYRALQRDVQELHRLVRAMTRQQHRDARDAKYDNWKRTKL